MAKEIERKYLVDGSSYRETATSAVRIRQAYLSTNPDATVRVRIAGDSAWLTVKGRNAGNVRDEWEYPIPVADAEAMLARCAQSPVIDKTRYRDGRWEIDEFHGSLEGLVVAEIELTSADEEYALPGYIGCEVSGDARYYNSSLAKSGRIPEGE